MCHRKGGYITGCRYFSKERKRKEEKEKERKREREWEKEREEERKRGREEGILDGLEQIQINLPFIRLASPEASPSALWNRLPRDGAIILEILKKPPVLDLGILDNLLRTFLLEQRRWMRWLPEVPSHLYNSVILWGWTVLGAPRKCSSTASAAASMLPQGWLGTSLSTSMGSQRECQPFLSY